MFKTLLLTVMFLVLSSTTALAWSVGDVVITQAYCTTIEDTARLSTAIVKEGDIGYLRIMNEPTSMCFDTRYHSNVKAVRVKIAEYLFNILNKSDDTVYTFWMATSMASDTPGYIWTYDEEKSKPENPTKSKGFKV